MRVELILSCMKFHVTSLDAFSHERGERREVLSESDGCDESAEGFVVVDLSESESSVNGFKAVSCPADQADWEWQAQFAIEFAFSLCPNREWLVCAGSAGVADSGGTDGPRVLSQGSCAGTDAIQDAFVVRDCAICRGLCKVRGFFDAPGEGFAVNAFSEMIERLEGE